MMSISIPIAAAPQATISAVGLVNYLQEAFSGPLFLGLIGIVALYFLFTREITPRFVQFIVLAVTP